MNAVYLELNSPAALSSWVSSSINSCDGTWTGVSCISGGTLITGLDLSYLSPPLTGTLPKALQYLTSLTSFGMAGNAPGINGALPLEYSVLTGLTSLQLQQNALQGSLPASWSRLNRLISLNLGFNALTSTVPVSWTAMTSLNRLFMTNNSLACGVLPGSLATPGRVVVTGSGLGAACPMPPPAPPSATGSLYALRQACNPSTWPTTLSGWDATSDPCGSSPVWGGINCTNGQVTDIDLSYQTIQGVLPDNLMYLTALKTLNLEGNRWEFSPYDLIISVFP